jgi:oligoendopeptidase F
MRLCWKVFLSILMLVTLAFLPSTIVAQVQEAPTRDQIKDQDKWNLADFFPTDEAWEKELESLKGRINDITKYKGKLGESAANLASCLMLNDTLGMKAHHLWVYATLKLHEDTRVSKYQGMSDNAYSLYAQIGQATSYLEPEILKIPDATLRSFLGNNPGLAVYRFYLEDILRRKSHIRTQEVEEVLALAGDATAGPERIFTAMEDADIKFPNIKDENGNEIELTQGRLGQILESQNRDYRRRASQAYNETYKKYANGMSACLASEVNGDVFYTKARGYSSCLERGLDDYNIPVSVFHSLVKAVNDNLEPLHKYISLRKKALGVDTLFGFDLSVPLVPQSQKKFTWEQAKTYMLEGLKPMGSDYLADVKMALNSRWIDVYENQGKYSGGYSWATYPSHPVMLLNFVGTLDDVSTLAHEMGHMMNYYQAYKHEPYVYSGQSKFTAEVASTCNEAIMIKYMLAHAKDRNEKLYLLNYYIDQIIGTFYTQAWFSEFELKIHEIVESGDALSTDVFRKVYREIFQKYYGPDFYLPPDRDYGGMRISHFYKMYYVYQYATSYAASQMLSQKIMAGDKKAIQAYKEFIQTGSSDYPVNILKKAGVDMTTTEPFQNTIRVFADLVDQYEKLLLTK